MAKVGLSPVTSALRATTGVWLPRHRKNIQLVKELRQAWRLAQIRRGRGAVRIEHVRSHTAVPGNELADMLAEKGRWLGPFSEECTTADARRIMTGIALAANTRDPRKGRGPPQPPSPNHQPHQPPQPLQPFTIYQTPQNPDDRQIRDDG